MSLVAAGLQAAGTSITEQPLLLATLVAAVGLRGQAPPVPRAPLAFDVVSVKPNTSGEQGGASRAQPGRYQGINVTLKRVIALAYRPVQEFAGGPDWINTAHFDIEAGTDGNPSQEQMLEMLRTLLADRFKLVVHKQTKDSSVYGQRTAVGAGTRTAMRIQAGHWRAERPGDDDGQAGRRALVRGTSGG